MNWPFVPARAARTLAAVCLCLVSAPAWAMSVDDYAKITVIAGWRMENGNHMAGIRIQLAPGWKTYWRKPGDAGIPPEFDWTGSQNMSAVAIHWPVPKPFEQNGMTSLGYTDEVVLPLEIWPNAAGDIRLRARMLLGVCSDICIPTEVTLRALLPSGGSADADILASLSHEVGDASERGLPQPGCAITPIADGLAIAVSVALAGADHVVIETGDPTIWVSEPVLSHGPDTTLAEAELVPASAAPFVLSRSDVRVTVFTGDDAVEFNGCVATN